MDCDAFTDCVNKFQKTVYRVAYSYVKNISDAEDITQETFLKLYRSEEKFSTDENVKAWLITAAVNLSKNHLRSVWMRKRVPLEQEPELTDSSERELLEEINRLKPEYRIVLYLFCYEGYSTKEISAITGISDSNVRTRLKRAREKLRAYLSE